MALTGLLVLGGASSGCAPSGRDAAVPPRPSATPATTTTTTRPPAAGPQLDQMIVQPGDLPANWVGRRPTPDPAQAANSAAFAKCLGIPNTNPNTVATARSPVFSLGSAQITSLAASYRSTSDVETDAAGLASTKATACLSQLVQSQVTATLPRGATVRNTLKVLPGAGSGPTNVVATVSGTVTITQKGGQQGTLVESIVFMTGPRIEAQLVFVGLGQGVPAALRTALVEKMANRIAQG